MQKMERFEKGVDRSRYFADRPQNAINHFNFILVIFYCTIIFKLVMLNGRPGRAEFGRPISTEWPAGQAGQPKFKKNPPNRI